MTRRRCNDAGAGTRNSGMALLLDHSILAVTTTLPAVRIVRLQRKSREIEKTPDCPKLRQWRDGDRSG